MVMASAMNTDPRGKPWKMMGTRMAPQILLMNKLLFTLLLLHGISSKFRGPFLPFISFLDRLPFSPDFVGFALGTLFIVAGIMLLFNIAVRPAALTLGLVIIFALLGSKSMFRNHLFICGCLFFLSSLHKNDEQPWLLYLQMSLLYFGAGLNKMFEADWHTGQFMHSWLVNERENPIYEAIYSFLPDMSLAIFMSWSAIALELTLAALFVFSRTRSVGVWLAVLFHGWLFVFLIGENFGHFLEDILISFIAFLVWPRGEIVVAVRKEGSQWLTRFVRLVDWDGRIKIVRSLNEPSNWLSIRVAGRTDENRIRKKRRNIDALRYIIRYSAGWYVILFAGYHVALRFITPPVGFVVVVLTGFAIILFFAPMRFQKKEPEITS